MKKSGFCGHYNSLKIIWLPNPNFHKCEHNVLAVETICPRRQKRASQVAGKKLPDFCKIAHHFIEDRRYYTVHSQNELKYYWKVDFLVKGWH